MLAHLDVTLLVTLNVVVLCSGQKPQQKNPLAPIDMAHLESKDVLLQMLEKKLKEIKDNKKQKNGNADVLPKNVDFSLKSNGISAVGDAELLLRYGKMGQGILNLTADGMSNVGRVQLVVGTGDNGLYIPGLSNLFVAPSVKSEDKNAQNQLPLVNADDINYGFRRQTNVSSATNVIDKVNNNNPATDVVEGKVADETKGDTSSSATTGKIESASVSVAASQANIANVNVAGALSQVVPESSSASSNSPVLSSDSTIKSSSVPINPVASNVENVNKVGTVAV